MVAELVLLQESSVRPLLCFPLRAGRFVLGRSADCDFVILDQHVSRRHVQIAVANGRATVREWRTLKQQWLYLNTLDTVGSP